MQLLAANAELKRQHDLKSHCFLYDPLWCFYYILVSSICLYLLLYIVWCSKMCKLQRFPNCEILEVASVYISLQTSLWIWGSGRSSCSKDFNSAAAHGEAPLFVAAQCPSHLTGEGGRSSRINMMGRICRYHCFTMLNCWTLQYITVEWFFILYLSVIYNIYTSFSCRTEPRCWLTCSACCLSARFSFGGVQSWYFGVIWSESCIMFAPVVERSRLCHAKLLTLPLMSTWSLIILHKELNSLWGLAEDIALRDSEQGIVYSWILLDIAGYLVNRSRPRFSCITIRSAICWAWLEEVPSYLWQQRYGYLEMVRCLVQLESTWNHLEDMYVALVNSYLGPIDSAPPLPAELAFSW